MAAPIHCVGEESLQRDRIKSQFIIIIIAIIIIITIIVIFLESLTFYYTTYGGLV